jgi:hypothetical protein
MSGLKSVRRKGVCRENVAAPNKSGSDSEKDSQTKIRFLNFEKLFLFLFLFVGDVLNVTPDHFACLISSLISLSYFVKCCILQIVILLSVNWLDAIWFDMPLCHLVGYIRLGVLWLDDIWLGVFLLNVILLSHSDDCHSVD